MDHTIGFVSQNLVSQANCVEFRDTRIFMLLEVERASDRVTRGMKVHATQHQAC